MKASKTPDPDATAFEQLQAWTGIAPLERFVSPPELDGRKGTYRCEDACRVTATTDLEAIRQWIDHDTPSASTIRGRQAAAEKLLNWAVFARGKALSSLERHEFVQFVHFLAAPIPYATWVRRTSPPRTSTDWRPFRGPLALNSQLATMAHVSSLVQWMRIQRYGDLIMHGDWSTLNSSTAASSLKNKALASEAAEPITLEEWEWMRRALADLDSHHDGLVRRLVVEMLYYGELFVQELIEIDERDVEQPSRLCPSWYVHVGSRPAARGGQMFFLPPPLAQTLTTWLKATPQRVGLSFLVDLGFDAQGKPLLGCTAEQVLRHVRAVMRHASRMALAAGHTAIGRSLQDRSVPSLRLAFARHRRRRHDEYEAWGLTRDIGYRPEYLGLVNKAYRRRSLWDWSYAEHLWAPLS